MPKLAACLFPLIAIAALAAAGQGLAQSNTNGGSGYGPPSGPPGANGAPPAARESAADQARDLRTALSLRSDQEPALQTFVQAVTPTPQEKARVSQAQTGAQTLTTPQRLDQMLARMDEMRAIMANRVAATKRFYQQLTPTQQHAFDTLRPPGQQGQQNAAPRQTYQGQSY